MKALIKTSFILSFLLSFQLICLPQSQVNAQDFLKKFLSNSSIKNGKQLKSDGDYPSAITAFTKSIKRKPENLEAYYQLGLIFEEILYDYDKAISLYKGVITLSEGLKPTGTDEELKIFNSLITNAKMSIDRTIGKKFESIERPKVPVYIMVKPYQKILKEPKMFSTSKYKTTSFASEFKLLDFSGNWYQINVPSIGSGWINGKNVLKITQKEKKAIETSPAGKAALYQRFADLYPDSRFAQNAKDKADDIYYGLANEENSINSFSMYLRKHPDGKYVKVARLKLDTLTLDDESFFNNINRLRHWITNNPESTFIEKAKKRINELTFAQAKYDNNTVSLEGYIIDYPDGKFVSEAKQLIEDIKYNHAKSIDTLVSYRKYLDEYPDGKYAHDAAKRIDEKEFSTLLNSQNIELLVEHLKNEANEERKGLVKNKIEKLYFKKADGVNNDIDAIKIYEDYLLKYPDGLFAREAETRIEELFFNVATKTNTKDAFLDFIRKYPQSKRYKEAIDGIEVLNFNVALSEDTIEAYEHFVKEYPDSRLTTTAKGIIETKYFENASQKGTVEVYKEYVELYPDGSHLGEAQLIIDKLTFEPYKEKGSVSGFEKFIKKYPDNRYVENALAIIDQLDFEYYQKKNTLKAYKKFVTKYPDNRYVNEAKQKIILLQTSNIGEESDSGFPYLLTIIIFSGVGIAIACVLMRKRVVSMVQSWQQGDWSCECGTKHNKDLENCSVCKNTRPKFNKASWIGYAIWLREKLYAMYGKLPEKEVITQKTKDIQGKAINTFGKIKEYHDKLEKERNGKYQKVKEKPASSKLFTTAGIVILVFCFILIPLMFFLVGSNERLPEVYGVYAEDRGSIITMAPSGAPPILKKDCKFIVFDNTLTHGLVKPNQVISLLPRLFVRKKVEHICPSSDSSPTRINVSDAGYFDAFKPLIKLEFAPIEGHPGMVRVLPLSSLAEGLYYLEFEDQRYPFSINTTPVHNLDQYSVDNHYKTILGNADFSWGKRISLTREGLYGNRIPGTEYKPIDELTKIRDELRQSARDAISQRQFTTAIINTESYETIQPSDTSLREALSQGLAQVTQEALDHEDWAAVAVYAEVADEVNFNSEMQAIKLKAVNHLNNYDSAEQRFEFSKKPKKTLWTPKAGEQLRYHEGVSTNFRITDVGIFATFGKQSMKEFLIKSVNRIVKTTAKAHLGWLKYSEERPGIHVSRAVGYDVKLVLTSTERRDECYKILVKAFEEWRVNNSLGHISITSVTGGKLLYKFTILNRAWTPEVVFSSRLRFDRIGATGWGQSYRLWNTSTGETVSSRDIIDARSQDNQENLIPQGVPIRFMGTGKYACELELEYVLP